MPIFLKRTACHQYYTLNLSMHYRLKYANPNSNLNPKPQILNPTLGLYCLR